MSEHELMIIEPGTDETPLVILFHREECEEHPGERHIHTEVRGTVTLSEVPEVLTVIEQLGALMSRDYKSALAQVRKPSEN